MKKLTHQELTELRLQEETAGRPEGRFPFIAILENIRSLYNVGSIFRTSDGARIEAIYTIGYTPHPPRPEIDKTALGATRTIPSKHFATIEEAVHEARSLGFNIGALELTSNSKSVYDLQKEDFPFALIIGNEITGVSDEALALCDFALEIPMLGTKHSLNVAVAYGIGLFECVRVYKDELQKYR